MTKKKLESYLIAYPLFCNSKKFSLRNYLLNNNTASYKDFKKFLINKSVQPPREEYFNLVKMSIEKDKNEKNKKVDAKKSAETQEANISISKTKVKKRTYRKRKSKVNEKDTNE
tara:strand:- start:979 stop:1320 length:342 start_codon:yes stop_codon:yes gene_type:complete